MAESDVVVLQTVGEYEKEHGVSLRSKKIRNSVKKTEQEREKLFLERLDDRRRSRGVRTISRAEVARHNKKQDGYVIIDGVVYDVTDFFQHHPGGPQVLMEFLGKDATVKFEGMFPISFRSETPTRGCEQMQEL
eukprot:488697-Hanusia_phi.AAC.2